MNFAYRCGSADRRDNTLGADEISRPFPPMDRKGHLLQLTRYSVKSVPRSRKLKNPRRQVNTGEQRIGSRSTRTRLGHSAAKRSSEPSERAKKSMSRG